ncbi:MAG: adenylate/guanylate cyclase domain-containing protein [Paracoccaceae bacterium]
MTIERKNDWSALAIIQWLMREGRLLGDRDRLLEGLGERMLAEGAPVARIRVAMRTLHPMVRAISSTWETEVGVTPAIEAQHGFDVSASYRGSPIEIITTTREPYRRRLDDTLGPNDPAVLHELRQDGMTDYFGRLLLFSSGPAAILTISSATPGGFSDDDLEKINLIAGAMSPIVEVFHAYQIAEAVAEAYLGPRTGRRVLDGQITRGDIETIEAAILISDLRGWTRMNQNLPPEETVALANRYFETVAAAVDAYDGEILKFLGDGVLAIFPDDAARACQQALDAAVMAQSNADGVDFGVGMHFGRVMYGNVGSAERIDFTVLGQAVNLAARIESLCGETGQPILYSDRFAAALDGTSREVTRQLLKGLDDPVTIFAPQSRT